MLDRIKDRIEDLKAQGQSVSERSISMDATGSPDTIRNWRRAVAAGKAAGATTSKLAQVAQALGVTAEWLMSEQPNQPDSRSETIAEIVGLLRELDPAELEMLRAAAHGVHARRRGGA